MILTTVKKKGWIRCSNIQKKGGKKGLWEGTRRPSKKGEGRGASFCWRPPGDRRKARQTKRFAEGKNRQGEIRGVKHQRNNLKDEPRQVGGGKNLAHGVV